MAVGWIELASLFANSGILPRPGRSLSALVDRALRKAFALSCFAGAIALGLVAIGLAIAPFLGAPIALAVDAVLVAMIGVASFPWTRGRSKPRASAPSGALLEALVAHVSELLKREKGLSIVAGLLLGLIVGGSRKLGRPFE